MISPVTNEENQKLLEALTIQDKIESLDVDDLIDFKIAELIFQDKGIEWLMT